MILVLDTNALWHKPLLDSLKVAREAGMAQVTGILPTIAYAERRRQLLRDDRSVDEFQEMVESVGLVLEPFGPIEAERLPPTAADDREWRLHARDFLVSAHVTPGRILVTADHGSHFAGVTVRTPGDAAAAVAGLVL